MKKHLLVVGLVAMTSLMISCSKDDDKVVQLTKTELIARAWKMTAMNITFSGTTMNFIDSMPACLLDNLYTFSTNGVYKSEEGLTKCDPSDPTVVETGTWLFMQNETKLKMNVNSWSFPDDEIPWSDEIIWDVVSLSATKMELKYIIPANGTLPEIKVEVTFTAQ